MMRLQALKEHCAELHREVEVLRRLEEEDRARKGEEERNELFRAVRASHWKLKKGIPGGSGMGRKLYVTQRRD